LAIGDKSSMSDPLFILIKEDTINLADISSMTVDMAISPLSEDSDPRCGWDIVVQMRGAASPTRYRYASRDEALAQQREIQQYMRAHGFLERQF